jgi:hypothetical protein
MRVLTVYIMAILSVFCRVNWYRFNISYTVGEKQMLLIPYLIEYMMLNWSVMIWEDDLSSWS